MHSGATATRWKLGHMPGLDGLRGVAILMVVVAHLDVAFLDPFGTMGVTVFFTLSGFLITALLLREVDVTSRLSMRGFYRRRFFRLAPAFLLMLAVVVPIEFGLYGYAPYWWAPVLEVSNWVSATQGAGALQLLHHTWSLAIEEQFYVVWPLALLVAVRAAGRRGVVAVATLGVVASLVASSLAHGPHLAYGTDTNAAALLAGCLLAAVMVDRRVWTAPSYAVPVAGALLIAAAAGLTVGPVVPVATVLAIWAVTTRQPVWLGWAPLRGAGRISYGWYLWNYPLVLLATIGHFSLYAVPVASLGFALLSWRYLEEPMMRLGRRGHAGTNKPPIAVRVEPAPRPELA